jgi:hypothetical protein
VITSRSVKCSPRASHFLSSRTYDPALPHSRISPNTAIYLRTYISTPPANAPHPPSSHHLPQYHQISTEDSRFMHPTWQRAGLQRPGGHHLGTGNRAAELTQQANDLQQLEPMLAATAATLAAAGVPERPGEAAGGRRLLDDRQPDPDPGRAGAADPPSGTAARASALPTLPRHPRQPRRAHHPCVTRSTRRW